MSEQTMAFGVVLVALLIVAVAVIAAFGPQVAQLFTFPMR